MGNSNLNVRAVICDIYGTLLTIEPPSASVLGGWNAFWKSIPGMQRELGLDEFSALIRQVIDGEHATARVGGVAHPEIIWTDILTKVVPEFQPLSSGVRDDFFWQLTRFIHSVHLMPGAAKALEAIRAKGLVLGLASNAQVYTMRELDEALASAGLSRHLFDPALCFFSFEHGFSKPDPAVFRFFTKPLQARGIDKSQTLMVGNRDDNDILPARAEGWQTWHFTEKAAAETGYVGNWDQFLLALG